jgi:enterochelin esterase-like enzyme
VGLTSPALAILLAVLCCAQLLAVLTGWRKLAGPGRRNLALRAMSLITLQALVLSLIFVVVNRSGEFYSSWSDLAGSDNGQASVVTSADGRSVTADPVVVTSHATVRVPGSGASGGTLDSVRLSGQLSGLTVTGRVYLPAGYQQARRSVRYPLIIAISAGLSDPGSPYDAVRLAENAAALISAGRLEPVIIAMLPAELAPADQGCLDVPASPAAGSRPARAAIPGATFYSQDLPSMLASAFRASTSARGRALLGDAAGGYCALQLALTHSWVYSAAAAPAASYTRPPGPGGTGGSSQLADEDDLPWLLTHQPMQRISVLLTGTSPGGRPSPVESAARAPMRVSTAGLGSGTWPLAGVLSWLGAAISR